ncbi:MAG: S8 family serine peptidase, partial [Anaerolineae bacterium]
MSVIVTAGGSAAATRAVEHVGGRVTSDLWLIDAVAAAIPAAQLDALAAYPGVRSIVNNKPVRAAVEPDPDTLVMDQTWPVPVDVGADVLHTSGITGTGVGVAVVDSGMFFSPGLVNSQGQQVAIQYIGQADFVDKKNCQLGKTNCMNNGENSRDPYGHGSHVTGIIGNNFRDSATDLVLGIAPGADILSVRVLDENGLGTYEDVILGIQWTVSVKDLLNIRVMNLSLSAEATAPYFVDPLNRAVEEAWAAGIVVVAAAGNTGPAA